MGEPDQVTVEFHQVIVVIKGTRRIYSLKDVI